MLVRGMFGGRGVPKHMFWHTSIWMELVYDVLEGWAKGEGGVPPTWELSQLNATLTAEERVIKARKPTKRKSCFMVPWDDAQRPVYRGLGVGRLHIGGFILVDIGSCTVSIRSFEVRVSMVQCPF